MRSVSIHDLKTALDAGDTVVVDVREPEEYAAGHVPGARPVPLGSVPARAGELPTDQPVYLVCQSGGRSAQAAAFLSRQGVDAVNVDGGTGDWAAAGYPVEH